LQTIAGTTAEVRIDPARVRKRDVTSACGDATLAREALGWTPVIPWEQTLIDVLDDWRNRIGGSMQEI
jgi:nucleoside-diphosphate-sugar epimerase